MQCVDDLLEADAMGQITIPKTNEPLHRPGAGAYRLPCYTRTILQPIVWEFI